MDLRDASRVRAQPLHGIPDSILRMSFRLLVRVIFAMKAPLAAFVWIGCLLSGFTRGEDAGDPFADTGETKAGEAAARHRTPDHLQPLDPYPMDWEVAYTKQLSKYLDLKAPYLARMIVRPSFDPEYLMSIHGPPEDDYPGVDSQGFFVSCTVSDKSIWYSMRENNSEKVEKEIKPTTSTAPLPAEVARKVYGLWNEMLLGTRYTRELNAGLDGVTIEFATHLKHGEAWSPSVGTSPALLWDLGEKLVAYCKAPVEERKKLLDAVNESAGKLDSYLKRGAGKGDIAPSAPKAESKSESDKKSPGGE